MAEVLADSDTPFRLILEAIAPLGHALVHLKRRKPKH